jgi:hypothetical protein
MDSMSQGFRISTFQLAALAMLLLGRFAVAQAPASASNDMAQAIAKLFKQLNDQPSVKTTEDNKSYRIIWDAYLQLTPPPMPVGPEFNLNTIHPKMSQWAAVATWAESNGAIAQAILKVRDKIVFGLPYGTEALDSKYVTAKLTALVGADGVLRKNEFLYLEAIDTIAAFVTAETYRLLEAGQIKPALDLAIAHAFLVRQLCDREFLAEKFHSIALLTDVLDNLRDQFYLYFDKISAEEFTRLAKQEIPYLRPDRNRLLMPEADRLFAAAVIEEVFDSKTNSPDVDKFASTFAEVQSREAPLTRFGAAKRWRNIAEVHGSRQASLERLNLIYDDWWRRWRVQEYDEILSFDTQFERTNPIRYAAVIFSLQNVEALFQVRNKLIVEVNGTAAAAGLCGYKKSFGVYPDQLEKCYAQFMLKRSDADPYDREIRPFIYFLVDKERVSIDTPAGRLWLDPSDKPCLLLSVGQDHEDQRGVTHSHHGATTGEDIVIWPPVTAMEREQGLIQ